ncbi:hypothetical protein ACQPZJ_15040 [Actinoplanes sp. CA-054009]
MSWSEVMPRPPAAPRCRAQSHRAELPTVRQRLIRRHDDDEVLRWHLDRSGELDEILRRARTEDVVVDATTTSIRRTAEAVIAAINW